MNPNVGLFLNETLQSGYIGQGKKVEEFESVLSAYFKTPYINTINSATSGIHLALHIFKIFDQSGRDEVITTPLTCVATNFPILANGLKIRWSDLDPHTCNINLDDVKRKINSKTLALIVVHWAGTPCDLDQIEELKIWYKQKFGNDLFVIEDCAHALGSSYKGKIIGNSTNFCVFSFQAVKQITTGDGGALICPNKQFHEKAKLLRWYGLDRNSSIDYRCEQDIHDWGYKFHMNDIAATIGLANFPYLHQIVKKHQENYEWLRSKIQNHPDIETTWTSLEHQSANWIMTLLVNKRNSFVKKMKSLGIQVSPVHHRNDEYSCLKEFKSELISTNYVCDRMCCIPCGWWVSSEDRSYILNAILEGW